MQTRVVIICTLTDDPFAPAGRGGYGGSHPAISNVGRHLIRAGYYVIFITRRMSTGQAETLELGPKCKLIRIEGGPIQPIPYHQVVEYSEAMTTNILSLIDKLNVSAEVSYLSYNWLSGEIIRRIRKEHTGQHIHLVLALSISRLLEGEGTDKISEKWINFEYNTFLDSDYILCGSVHEKEMIKNHFSEIKENKLLVLNYGIDTGVFFRRPGPENNYFRRSSEKFQEGLDYSS